MLRSLALAAFAATLAQPLRAQRPAQSGAAPVPPAVPAMPPIPHVGNVDSIGPVMEQWGKSMGEWGQSVGKSMGALGDSLARIGSQLGAAESDETVRTSDAGRARIDSLRQAMDRIGKQMASAHSHDRNWREFARQTHEAARQAKAMAGRGRSSPPSLIDRVRQDPEAMPLPPADSFATGALTIPAGTQHAGTAATQNGDLKVYGTVTGNAIALDGNIEVHPGATVLGSAFTAGGQVQVDSGGMVDGEIRSLTGDFGPLPTRVAARETSIRSSRWHEVRMALMGLALVLMLSIGVLTFADEQLDHVKATLADRFGRSAWYGLAGAVALGPALALMTLALTITVIGILVVPFAVAAYAAVAVGAAALGFMAVAEATGIALLSSHTQASLTARGAQLRAIVTGVSIYGGLWVLTAIVGVESTVGIVVRSIAAVVTAVAVIVGFGAVLLWRFDLRRESRAAAAAAMPADDAVWQTPTPVAGVAAASRTPPSATSSGRPS